MVKPILINMSEVTNIIEPVLLTKRHLGVIGKTKVSAMLPTMKLVALQYGLNLKKVADFRLTVKLIEDCVILN